MPNLLLIPRGTAKSGGPRHFANTVRRGVDIDAHRDVLGVHHAAVRRVVGEGRVRLWGTTPTYERSNAKARALRERRVGDDVVFYGEGTFFARARVGLLFDNREMARRIWGTDDNGVTWEHMLVLVDVEEFEPVPTSVVLPKVGMHPVVRSITLVGGTERRLILSALDA